jgi:HK97 family phage portal protein
VSTRGGWYSIIREPFTGAWQRDVEVRLVDVLTHPTVFACVSLIASDIAKMRPRLVALTGDGIWSETESPAFSPVLRKPNRYQTRIQFFKSWLTSKLAYGNAYILKQRDARRVVTALYVLDPNRVTPLVAPDGGVYYSLKEDHLSSQPQPEVTVPASEIIHDVMHALYHPLCGVSPIHACGLAATLGLKIQTNSANYFANGGVPSGILIAPGAISQAQAETLKTTWETNYGGSNYGKVAVLGDGLKYEPVEFNSQNTQSTEQWQDTAKAVAAAYHVPAYLVGAAEPPAYNNIQSLTQAYYSQCLQEPIESIELLLDEGLGLAEGKIEGRTLGTEFDLDDLLRMDSATLITTLAAGVGAAIYAPNEARRRVNLPPVDGGETPYLQVQNYSLSALDKRDSAQLPPASPAVVAQPAPVDEDEDEDEDEDKAFSWPTFMRSVQAPWLG